MNPTLQTLRGEACQKIAAASALEELEQIRIDYLGKKGAVSLLMQSLKDLSAEEKPLFGKSVNELKEELSSLLTRKKQELEVLHLNERFQKEQIDITLPGKRYLLGKKHPVVKVMDEAIEIFKGLGFTLEEGPEIESEYYNFEALNIPSDHPARDMQDTLYLESNQLLRTHTSPVQIRVMEKKKPPFRFIAAGKVYRHDSDVTHSPMFHQIEGFWVDEKTTFSDLKGLLETFLKELFHTDMELRFRPSFFPFTEPSAEVDISCVLCARKGCRVCKNTGWLEILGCGMVHPAVLEAVHLDSKKLQGFAFGLGIERIVMLKYGIQDIRLLFENDVRFLQQF